MTNRSVADSIRELGARVPDPDAPIAYSLTLTAEALPRMAAVFVHDQRTSLECPTWCTVDQDRKSVV